MRRDELLSLYDQDQRRDIEYPDTRREVLPHLIRHIDLTGREGTVLYSELSSDPAEVDETIREQMAYFEGAGQDFEWKVFAHDNPPDLKDRLAALGFEIDEPDAIMILDLQAAPAQRLAAPEGVDVRQLTDPAEIGDVVTVLREVWGKDFIRLGKQLAREIQEMPDYLNVFVGYVDGQPASCGWVYFPANSRFASLWGGSTLAAHRQRGFYTGLLAARAQAAQRQGRRFLTVDAGSMSRPILEKSGFQQLTTAYRCLWHVNRSEAE